VAGCSNVGPANLVAITGGLGFSLTKPQCDDLGIGMSMNEDIALCLGRALSCQTDSVVARLEPRASEVLTANGHGIHVPCMPALAAGNATGHDGPALLACQD